MELTWGILPHETIQGEWPRMAVARAADAQAKHELNLNRSALIHVLTAEHLRSAFRF